MIKTFVFFVFFVVKSSSLDSRSAVIPDKAEPRSGIHFERRIWIPALAGTTALIET
jgi:hypothetical protein